MISAGAGALILVVMIARRHEESRPAPILLGSFSALILLVGFLDYRDVDRRLKELSGSPVVAHTRIGLYLTIGAGIVGVAAAGTRIGNRSAGGRS
jgi:hypothetical protein